MPSDKQQRDGSGGTGGTMSTVNNNEGVPPPPSYNSQWHHQSQGQIRPAINNYYQTIMNCKHCHNRVVTQTKHVRNFGSCCLRVCMIMAGCFLLMVVVCMTTAEVKHHLNGEPLRRSNVLFLLHVFCLLFCCCIPRVYREIHNWRVYHFCPRCGKRIASVPSDAPIGAMP